MQEMTLWNLARCAAALSLVLYLSLSFLPLLALGRMTLIRRSPQQGHLARQIMRLQSLLALIPVLAWATLLLPGVDLPETALHGPVREQLWVFSVCVGVGVLLSWVVSLCWGGLRKLTALLMLLLMLIVLAFWAAVWPLMTVVENGWLLRSGLADMLSTYSEWSLPWFTAPFRLRMDALLAVLLWLMGPALAGGLALIWLLVRRGLDDFGRDYYAFAARVCASFAAAGGLLALMSFTAFCKLLLPALSNVTLNLPAGLNRAGEWLYGLMGADTVAQWGFAAVPPGAGLMCLAMPLLAGLSALLWFLVARSPLPMRHKVSFVLAPLPLLAALCVVMSLFGVIHGFNVS